MGWPIVIDPAVAAGRSLLGTAIGDSLGLPYEGLAAGRGLRLMPLPLRQRMLFGRGFLSDDTLQSAFVLRSLIRYPDDPARFVADFAKGLRLWFLSIPPGIGLSTIKACSRLCIGFSPDRSGVRSAGNGAAMRSAVIGAFFYKDAAARIQLVEASATVTHTHPLAIQGSQLIALAAVHEIADTCATYREEAATLVPDWPWTQGWPDRGPSGYVVHSVNAAIHIWQTTRDFKSAMEMVVTLGGDTDSVGAMVGGIMGSTQTNSIPRAWLRYRGWPQPDECLTAEVKRVPYLRLLGTNLLSLPIILSFGFRRLFPPYCESSTRK